MKQFIQRFCCFAILMCNLHTATLFAQDSYASIGSSIYDIAPMHTEPVSTVPGCYPPSLNHKDLTSSSFNVTWIHYGPYNVHGSSYAAVLKYEIQLLDNQSNAIGVPIVVVTPMLGTTANGSQITQDLTQAFTGLQANTAYKVKIRQFCNLSPAPNAWSDYNVIDVMTLDPSNCNIFTNINFAHKYYATAPTNTYALDVRYKSVLAGVQCNVIVKDLRGNIVFSNNFATATSIGYSSANFELNNLDPCNQYIVTATVDNCSVGLSATVNTSCCNAVDEAVITDRSPTTITANWVVDPTQIIDTYLASFTVTLQKINSDGTITDIETHQENYGYDPTIPLSYTFNNLDPTEQYQVRVTPTCDACSCECLVQAPSHGTSANSIGRSNTCDLIGGSVYAQDHCTPATNVEITSIQSNALTISFNHTPSLSNKKYYVELIEKSTGALLDSEWSQLGEDTPWSYTKTFQGLKDNTEYTIKVKTYCGRETTFSNNNPPNFIAEKEAKTLQNLCNAATNFSATKTTASSIEVTWKNPETKLKRFVVQIQKGGYVVSSKEILSDGKANQILTCTFDGLEANTEYLIKISSQCCMGATAGVCNAWSEGEGVNFTAKTLADEPATCKENPTTFTLVPTGNEVAINWKPIKPELDNGGRRFLIDYGQEDIFVLDNSSKNTIKHLEAGKSYTFKIREVFDGYGSVYTSACAVQNKDIVIEGNPCPEDFNAKVQCPGIGSMMIHFNGDMPKDSRLAVRYRDASQEIATVIGKKSTDYCGSMEACDIPINTVVSIALNKNAFPSNDAILDKDNNYILKGLSNCSIYEIEAELFIKLANGSEIACKKIVFPTYFHTLADVNTPGVNSITNIDGFNDVNKNGIDDECEKYSEPTQNPPATNLGDILCGGKLPFADNNDVGIPYTSGKVGSIFYINGFPLEITELKNRTGNSYTGQGVVALPISEDKLVVEFSGITVNELKGNTLKVVGGTVKGVNDADIVAASGVVKTSRPKISDIIKAIDDDNLKKTEKFCDEPEPEKIDNTGLKDGFDKDGNYAMKPPYDGYSDGDPTDKKFNPQGFDKDGNSTNGTKYNDCGFDKDGNCNVTFAPKGVCDPKSCQGPYYWKVAGLTTTYGGQLFDKEKDNLKAEVIKILKDQLTERQKEVVPFAKISKDIRDKMVTDQVALAYDKPLVFGDKDKWINLGMHKFFKKAPVPFAVNMARLPKHEELEVLHKDLYYADVNEYKVQLYIDIIKELQTDKPLDAYLVTLGQRIKTMDNDKAENALKDPTRKLFLDWLKLQVVKKIDYDYGIKKSTASVDPRNDEQAAYAVSSAKKLIQNASPYINTDNINIAAVDNNIFDDIQRMKENEPEKYAAWQEQNLQFDFNQGFEKVGGISRAFVLRAINQQRLIDQYLAGEDNVMAASTSVGQPIIKGSPASPGSAQKDPEKVIYYDQFVFDAAKGAHVNIYCIVNTGKKEFVVQAINAPLSFDGFKEPVKLGLGTDFTFPISNIARFTLRGAKATPAPTDGNSCTDTQNAGEQGTFVEVDCHGFRKINVDIKIEFCDKYITPLDPDMKNVLQGKMVEGTFKASATSFHDIVVNCIDISPFTLTKHPDFKFKISGLVLDFSSESTPSTVKFPNNYITTFASSVPTTTGGTTTPVLTPTPAWKGFYAADIKVVLPEKFNGSNGNPRTVFAKDFIIDEGGITGIVGATNIFDIDQGSKIGGWRFSMSELNLTFVRNKPVGAGFKGKIHLPILEKDENWLYEAAILPGGDYQFAVTPEKQSTVDLWVAKVAFDKASFVQIKKVGDKDLVATAVLNGKVDFAGSGKSVVDIKDISFSKLAISSAESNPIVNPGTWSAPSVDAHVKGFTFYLGGIGLRRGKTENNKTESFLDFDIKLSLAKDDGKDKTTPSVDNPANTTGKQSQKLDISAGGSFTLVGKISINAAKEQEWEYDRLKVNGLSVHCETNTFRLHGEIKFFENSGDYGEGFFGAVDFAIPKAKVGASVMAIFGKMPTTNTAKYPDGFYKYFILDAMVNVPIQAGPIEFTGLGGGVSWHMSRVEPTSTTFTNAKLDLDVPKTVSGVTYKPDEEFGLGIRLMTTLQVAKTPRTFNGGAVLEVMFNSEGGLSYIALQGVAHFMADPDPTASFVLNPASIKDGIHADLKMKMDVEKSEFSANMVAYIYVGGGTVMGCADGCDKKKLGSMEIFIGQTDWFINIGRTNPDFKNRVSLGIGIENGPTILASAYLNIGNKLPPMAPLPAWAEKLVGNGLTVKDESSRASGKGFAFGAAIKTGFGGDQKLYGKVSVYGQVTLDAGFDIMMQDYGDTRCANNANRQIGINGWYANGQLYALIAGEVGVKYKDTKFPLLDCGVAAVLQAKGPNPFWAKGAVNVHYNILFGVVKGEANFVTEIGKKCEIAGQTGGTSGLDSKIIADITPENDVIDVNLSTKPEVNFNFPMNEIFLFTPLSGEPYPVNAVVKSVTVLKNGVAVSPNKYSLRYKNANTKIKIVFNEMLDAKAEYTVTAEAFANAIHPITKKETKIAGSDETKTVKFKTQASLDEIPKGNIGVSYPKDGMYNYYKEEDKSNKGFLILKQGQGYLLNSLPDGYAESTVIIYKRGVADPNAPAAEDGDPGEQIVATSPFSYNDGTKKVSFSMPNDKLEKETYYKMQFVQKHDYDSKKNKVLLTYYFRTSKYGTFYQKMNASQITSTKVPGTFVYNMGVTGNDEPFDDKEMEATDGRIPLVVSTANVSTSDWFQKFAYPKLYLPYPVQITRAAIGKIGIQEVNIDFDNDNEYNPVKVNVDKMLTFSKIQDSSLPPVNDETYLKGSGAPIIKGLQGIKFTIYDFTFNAIKEINPQLSAANVKLGVYSSELVNISGCKNEACKQKVYHDYYDPNNKLWIIFETPPTKTNLTFFYVLPVDVYVDPEGNGEFEGSNGGKKNALSFKQQFINSTQPTSIVDRDVDTK
jgi:hypothetical protein